MSAHELHLRVRRQVQQQRRLLTIELLRKSHDRLRAPCRTIGRSVNADVEGLLLYDPGDVQTQQEHATSCPGYVYGPPVTLAADYRFLNQNGINHVGRLTTNTR